MRKFVTKKLVLVVLLSMIIPATGFAADTIKIGVAGPHSGDLAAYGIPTKEAAEMVAAQVNAAGGVLEKLTKTRSRATKTNRAAAIIRWPNMRLQTVDLTGAGAAN